MGKLFNKNVISIIGAATIIILLHYAGLLSNIENIVVSILQPAERIALQSGAKLQTVYDRTTDKRDLYALNKQFEAENLELLNENIELKMLVEENNVLRQQLQFYSKNDYNKVLANVVSRGEGINVGAIIALDKGSVDGVKINQAMLVSDGVIVGKIFKVTEHQSFGRLITDKESNIATSIVGRGDVNGLLSGELGLTAKMNFISQEANLEINDLVITSGLEALVPKGLLVGSVKSIEKTASELFQSTIVESLVNLNNLSIVSILLF